MTTTDALTVGWGSPPLTGHTGLWLDRLSPCLQRPGEWLKVGPFQGYKQAERHATNMKKGAYKLPEADFDGQWQFTSRGSRKLSKSWLYVRFVLEGSNDDQWEQADGEITAVFEEPERARGVPVIEGTTEDEEPGFIPEEGEHPHEFPYPASGEGEKYPF